MPSPLTPPLLAFLSKLSFPRLFLVTAALFLVDLVVPDLIPLADELLLGLGTMLLGSFKRRRQEPIDPAPR